MLRPNYFANRAVIGTRSQGGTDEANSRRQGSLGPIAAVRNVFTVHETATADTGLGGALEENAITGAGAWLARNTSADMFNESRQGGLQ